jgi:hypothetical protein
MNCPNCGKPLPDSALSVRSLDPVDSGTNFDNFPKERSLEISVECDQCTFTGFARISSDDIIPTE